MAIRIITRKTNPTNCYGPTNPDNLNHPYTLHGRHARLKQELAAFEQDLKTKTGQEAEVDAALGGEAQKLSKQLEGNWRLGRIWCRADRAVWVIKGIAVVRFYKGCWEESYWTYVRSWNVVYWEGAWNNSVLGVREAGP